MQNVTNVFDEHEWAVLENRIYDALIERQNADINHAFGKLTDFVQATYIKLDLRLRQQNQKTSEISDEIAVLKLALANINQRLNDHLITEKVRIEELSATLHELQSLREKFAGFEVDE